MKFLWIIIVTLLILYTTTVCHYEFGLSLAAIEPSHDLDRHIPTIVNRTIHHHKHGKVGLGINRSNLVTILPIEPVLRPMPNNRKYATCRCLSQLTDTSNLTHITDNMLFNQYEYVQGHCFETVI